MSEFPPPTGRPVAYALRSDPWVELARQRRDRRAARRRRRKIWGGVAAVVLLAAGGVAAWRLLPTMVERFEQADIDPRPSRTAVATTRPSPVTQVAISELVYVDEVWLIDTGDDIYDWGVVLRSYVDEPVGEFSVTARFLGATDNVVGTETRSVARVGDGPAMVGGSARIVGLPVRLDVSVLSSGPLPDTLREPAEFVDVEFERVGAGTLDEDDDLVGRVSVGDGVVGQVVLVSAVWRDVRGDVTAAVFEDREVDADLEAGGQITFEIPLRRGRVPAGPPASVSVRWSQ